MPQALQLCLDKGKSFSIVFSPLSSSYAVSLFTPPPHVFLFLLNITQPLRNLLGWPKNAFGFFIYNDSSSA